MSEHKNPFLEPYGTLHDTVPFDRIRLEDYEEAFMEGIRRDNEYLEKTINNPEKSTFDNTILNPFDEGDGYYDLLGGYYSILFVTAPYPADIFSPSSANFGSAAPKPWVHPRSKPKSAAASTTDSYSAFVTLRSSGGSLSAR